LAPPPWLRAAPRLLEKTTGRCRPAPSVEPAIGVGIAQTLAVFRSIASAAFSRTRCLLPDANVGRSILIRRPTDTAVCIDRCTDPAYSVGDSNRAWCDRVAWRNWVKTRPPHDHSREVLVGVIAQCRQTGVIRSGLSFVPPVGSPVCHV
jgi:hypothetical protein